MSNEDKLQSLCEEQLIIRNINDDAHKQRLKEELIEIKAQDLHDYFLDLQGTKLKNDNNIIVPYLLGICDEFDINKKPEYEYGDFPDIDIDYIPQVRSYLKEKFTREQYGDDHVCNIVTYTTFGLRSALIDMCKVFDLDRKEILALTTRLGIKDDEGEILTWDKAIELYDELREYLEKHPEMADAAKHILNRNRNMGMHASGLIISGVPIHDFIPLVRVKNSSACSAWVEGLHGTDLGAVGLAKFDFLSLEGNMKIATGTLLASDEVDKALGICDSATRGIGKICALPGKSNWSDTRYLNDEKSLEMADKGDLKMIFQYDGSDGIRRLAREGGISSFDDLAAYTALYRPSCLKHGMHSAYCRRKNGKEEYTIHPKLDFLKKTYGVYCYQEDVLRVLNIVGKIPLKDCEIVRKAISKKKIDKFIKYKEMFITNGQEVLSQTKEEIEKLWDNIEAFAGYGFNLCVNKDTVIVDAESGNHHTIEDLYKTNNLISVHSLDKDYKVIKKKIARIIYNGKKTIYELRTRHGKTIKATGNHPFLTFAGWKDLSALSIGEKIATPRCLRVNGCTTKPDYEIISLAHLLTEGNTCHPSSLYFFNNDEIMIKEFVDNIQQFPSTRARSYKRNDNRWEVCANTGKLNSRSKCGAFLWAQKIGIINCKATQKFIPNEFLSLSNEQTAMFVGKLWAGDGHVCTKASGNPFYATSSLAMAKDIQLLLLRFRILSTLGPRKFKYKNDIKTGYVVSLTGEDSIINFIRIIGKYITGKQKEVYKLEGRNLNYNSYADLIPYQIIDTIKSTCVSKNIPLMQAARNANLCSRIFYNHKNKKGYFRKTIKAISDALNCDILKKYAESDIFWDEIVSIIPCGNEDTYDLTIDDTHNFVANGIIVHNSHCTVYGYISARMLYLKAHHPLPFYAATISHTKAAGPKDYQKLRDYKQEVEKHNIKMNKVDINNSGADCRIVDGQIYYGLSKLRGIGEEAAQRIEKLQPFRNYEDFVNRAGTDAKINQPVIALRLFEGDPKTNYKFYETFKIVEKKRTERTKRFNQNLNKYKEQLKSLTGSIEVDEDLYVHYDEEKMAKVNTAIRKITTSIINYKSRDIEIPTIESAQDVDVEIDPEYEKLLENLEAAEENYYGFVWTHPLELCKNYNHHTFEEFETNQLSFGPVDVQIKKVNEQKGPKVTYYSIEVEDATGEIKRITVWGDDYKRFKEELVNGACVRLTISAPNKGFRTYTLMSHPNKYKKPPKELDMRVFPID